MGGAWANSAISVMKPKDGLPVAASSAAAPARSYECSVPYAAGDRQTEVARLADDLAHRQLADVAGARDVASGALLGLQPQAL